MADLLKKMRPYQSEFSHQLACWAKSHRGWAKMKKANRKIAKRRAKRMAENEMKREAQDA